MNDNEYIRCRQTLLFCLGWKQAQIEMLHANSIQRYGRDELILWYTILGRAHDLTASGKTIQEVINMFAPDKIGQGE